MGVTSYGGRVVITGTIAHRRHGPQTGIADAATSLLTELLVAGV